MKDSTIPRDGRLASALVVSALLVAGCTAPSIDQQHGSTGSGLLSVYTVNYPLKYFAERIGGEQVIVTFPAPADEDPAYWIPGADTVAAYQQADLILLNGATYAKWVARVTLPQSKMLNTTEEVNERYITLKDAVVHSHGPGGEHAHEGTAFTTWLDPEIALAQAEAIYQTFVEMRPAHRDAFERNFNALKSDLESLDAELRTAVGPASQQPIAFSHPVFQYLTRKYRLNAMSVPWEPGVFPSSDAWADLERLLESHPSRWMIWEDEPLKQSVERLGELGVESVVFDPCGNTPADGDWLQVMQRNAQQLARVFSSSAVDSDNSP